MTDTSAIDNIIDQAEAKAASTPAPVVKDQTPSTGIGRPMSLGDAVTSGFSCDYWAAIEPHGFGVKGEDKVLETPLAVMIDLSDVQAVTSLRWGNPPNYEKTFDGITSDKGRPWNEAVREAAHAGQRPYTTATIPMTVVEETKIGGTTLQAGEVIGYTPPYTGATAFFSVVRAVQKEGAIIDGPDAVTIRLNVSARKKTNASAPKGFGLIVFEDVEVLE